MKIKRFRWNVTILALFILLASALTWVLVALYMKNFIRYSDEISSYEKTSYLAKAGTELWLAIVGSREVWVVYSIASWNDLMSWNFECPYPLNNEWICPQQPRFSLAIDWLWDSYNNCVSEGLVTVKTWFSVIIPLFKEHELHDDDLSNVLDLAATVNNRGSAWYEESITAYWDLSSERKYWVVWTKDNLLKIESRTGGTNKIWFNTDSSLWAREHAYLIVANPSTGNFQTICIKGSDIPQETVKLVSVGYFNWRQLWTETYATKALPDFLQGDNYLTNN